MARALATTILLVCGCSERARPEPALAPTATVSAPAPSKPAPPELRVARAPAAEPVQVAIVEPAVGQVLTADDAARTPIQVHSARPDWLLELALDGRRARPLATLPEKPTLGDLAGGALAPGGHYLVAALRATENEPARFAVARFTVGSGSVAGPLVYCGRPSGTVFGAVDQPLLLDFATDGFAPGTNGAVRVRALPARSTAEPAQALLREAGPWFVHLGSGDWSVELELLGSDGRPLAGPLSRHRCELTVNEASPP